MNLIQWLGFWSSFQSETTCGPGGSGRICPCFKKSAKLRWAFLKSTPSRVSSVANQRWISSRQPSSRKIDRWSSCESLLRFARWVSHLWRMKAFALPFLAFIIRFVSHKCGKNDKLVARLKFAQNGWAKQNFALEYLKFLFWNDATRRAFSFATLCHFEQ